MQQGSSNRVLAVWYWELSSPFVGYVCIRFKCGWKLEKMKLREWIRYEWEIAMEHHIYHLHAPAHTCTHTGWGKTQAHRYHHKMLKWNAWIGCDNEYTRCYPFRCTQLSNSNWKSVGATFQMYVAFSTIQPAIVLYPSDTHRRDVRATNQQIFMHTHTYIMNQSIEGNATFLSYK